MNSTSISFIVTRFVLSLLCIALFSIVNDSTAYASNDEQFCGEKCAGLLVIYEKRTGKPAPKELLGRCLDGCKKMLRSCRQNCRALVDTYVKNSGKQAPPTLLPTCLNTCLQRMNVTSKAQLKQHCKDSCTKILAQMGLHTNTTEMKACFETCIGKKPKKKQQ